MAQPSVAALALARSEGFIHPCFQKLLHRELRRLRAENDDLRQQRDILKKALGILSAEAPANVSR